MWGRIVRAAFRCSFVVSIALVWGNAVQAAAEPLAKVDDIPALPSAAVWTERKVHAGVAYFLDNMSARIRRFDAVADAWLADVPLPASASALAVDDSGIYVKFTDRVDRYGHDGALSASFPQVRGDWPMLELIGDYLVTGLGSEVSSYRKASGDLVDTSYSSHRMQGVSSMAAEGRIFGRAAAVNPSDIMMLAVDASNGAIERIIDSPYHGAFPGATVTHARGAGGFVVDGAGIVYSSAALEYRGSLGGPIQGAAFASDRFVVIRGGDLVVFTNGLRETGRIPAPTGLLDVASIDGRIHAISGTIDSLSIRPVDLAAAVPAQPPPARTWAEVLPRADFILGTGTDLLLVSRIAHAAYPFDATNWTFGPPIPLFVAPVHVAYSPLTRTIYAAQDGGAIHAYSGEAPGSPLWLAATPRTARGLAAAGEYVFAADESGPWASHYTFSPQGTALSRKDWNHLAPQYEWDPVLRRMYFFSNYSPSDLHWERIAADGTIVDAAESPYHGEVQAVSPIRISPDGARIVLGSGQVFESTSLTLVGNLGNRVADTAWLGGDLYTISTDDPPMLQRRGSDGQVVSSGRLRGTPRRLLPFGSGFLYVADAGPGTIVGRLDAFVAKADLAVDPLAPGAVFGGGSVVTLRVVVGNNGSVPAQGASVRGNLQGLGNPGWRCLPVRLVEGCAGATGGGGIDHAIDLADGGEAVFEITGRIPPTAQGEVEVVVAVYPAEPASDPELRNNRQVIRLKVDALFSGDFD